MTDKKKKSGRPIVLGVIAIFLLGFGGCTAYKWTGTGLYQGTVQRVYEKTNEYRVEFVTQNGETKVFTNADSSFPYWKTNSADVQAGLNSAVGNGDVIEVTTWGWRVSFSSSFPNVVDYEVIESPKQQALEDILVNYKENKITVEEATSQIKKWREK